MRRTKMVLGGAWLGVLLLGISMASANRRTDLALESGRVSQFRWTLAAFKDPTGKGRVCLRIFLRPTDLPIGEQRCVTLAETPDLFGVVDEYHHPKVTLTGLAFSDEADHVRLSFGGKKMKKVLKLRSVSPEQARKLGVDMFRYRGYAQSAGSCISRIEAFRSDDSQLYDSGGMRCGSGRG